MTHTYTRKAHRAAATAACAALVLALTSTVGSAHARSHDLGRESLPPGDGWGSTGSGTTGGARADAAHVYTVTTWAELKAALRKGGDTPKIIKVKGTLDATASGCAAFAAEGYDFARYLADYDPAVWGHDKQVSGVQEDLRAASAARQKPAITAEVPSHTTLIGVGGNAGIVGGSLQIKGADNVIVRNLTLESPLDCFPQWDPTDDNRTGAWNSEYDSAVVHGSTHIWMDHNTFTDGAHPDSTLPSYFGKIYEQHDGELDIVKGADRVTVSWNAFKDHDKTLMIGNSDGATGDAGRLKVTLHHNLFAGIVERAPRVRFGQVDAYNNLYTVTGEQKYQYAFGIGHQSQLVAEKNAFTLPAGVSAANILKKWSDAPVTATGNYVNGHSVDLVAVHNAEMPGEALRSGAGWTPALRTRVDDPRALPGLVGRRAGAGGAG
ncbi:pectate lyase [Streptomyces sp. ERV7]|uniref:pectate lyase family protein n=1 Tax=Streptomyces sp. ERV7 TaxID=1322334 RepID=UPI0007F3DC56|nr:pectate lyase [Streptomyces sp. ERV7]OAR26261.1 pectate lyase [Streptomyces sp. ERV7]